MKKITIIGAGNVGATIAYTLAVDGVANEIVIIDVKEESDIDSLFSAGGTTALLSQVSGLDDFELICFLVVK